VRPTSFIPRLISELEVDHDIQRRATELAARAKETALTNGCQPTGVAAACLYKARREEGQG